MRTPEIIKSHVDASMGRKPSDLYITNGQVVNTLTKEIYQADIAIKDNVIVRVGNISDLIASYPNVKTMDMNDSFLIPGLIDTHLHTESTLLTPTSFTQVALPRGTTTVVVDPHELTNVLGIPGLRYYLEETKKLPLEFLVEIPSCVPAAPPLETGPTTLASTEYEALTADNSFFALAEMMNYPGVIYGDDEVMIKLSLAEKYGKIREGHAPELKGIGLQAYLTAGISSCHESLSVQEVVEKLRLGMKIQLREGSFARNLLNLSMGIKNEFGINSDAWSNVITCSDDKHADDIFKEGHIDHSLRLLVNEIGLDPITAIQIATLNSANHLLRPDLGMIAPGKKANIVAINNLKEFDVLDVIAGGKHLAHHKKLLVDLVQPIIPTWAMNTVNPKYIPEIDEFGIKAPIDEGVLEAHIIGVIDHSLLTNHLVEKVKIENNHVVLDVKNDFGYFFLLDRYGKTNHFSKSLVSGFGFEGNVAVASTVAHDSHQLLIAGNDPKCMEIAMKSVIQSKGGQSIVAKKNGDIVVKSLPLPFAGLMSIESPEVISSTMSDMKEFSNEYVTAISEPFMSLSFMALPVIPKLKLTDKGIVDVEKFELIELFI